MLPIRLPRRLSFLSLLVGIVFGCCLISLVNQSRQLFYQDNVVVAEFRKEIQRADENQTTSSFQSQIIVDEEGKELCDKVRILCWILTSPENHETRALAVKETWGKRCNVLLFMSSANDSKLPSVELAVHEGRNGLWGKTREAFRYAWDRYQDEVDWFLKADDDTYVIVENLRYFLSAFNTSQPLWFGHKFKAIVKSGYFSGGAGYVLSKEATRRFVKEGYFNALLCRHDHEGAEDAEMGKCMENLKVSTMDSRDSKGRGRFHPFVPNNVYFPGNITQDYWYWKNIYYPPTRERDCCSDSTISFHYVDTKMMYLLEMFLYQIRPFGMVDRRSATPEPPPDFDLTASPWYAPNLTTAVTPSTVSPQDSSHPPNSTEVQRSQQHKQLLDYLLDQLKVYGIVDPNESSSVNSVKSAGNAAPNNTADNKTQGIINAQQMEYLRGYVMDQLEPFGIVDPTIQTNDKLVAGPFETATTATPINPSGLFDVHPGSSIIDTEAIANSQQTIRNNLRDYVMMSQQLQLSGMDLAEKMIADPITSTSSPSKTLNNPNVDAKALLMQMLRSLEAAQ